MIEVKNLVKKYGDKEALKGVSFSVNEGEILGFLGPNGAGKSTTMNIITGYLSSSSGTVTIDGDEILEKPLEVKKKIGYLPENPPLYLDMTTNAYLSFLFDLKKVKLNKKEHIKEICDLVKISDVENRLIKNLSKGYKQRVGLAGALLGYPSILILDEPTVGLDPKQIIEMRNLIKELGKKHTVILSSHILPEIQSVCDRVIVINNGAIIADDTTESLLGIGANCAKLLLQVEGEREKVRPILTKIDGIKKVTPGKKVETNVFEYTINADKSIKTRKMISQAIKNGGFNIVLMAFTSTNLEEIFLKLTNKENENKDKNMEEDSKCLQ